MIDHAEFSVSGQAIERNDLELLKGRNVTHENLSPVALRQFVTGTNVNPAHDRPREFNIGKVALWGAPVSDDSGNQSLVRMVVYALNDFLWRKWNFSVELI